MLNIRHDLRVAEDPPAYEVVDVLPPPPAYVPEVNPVDDKDQPVRDEKIQIEEKQVQQPDEPEQQYLGEAIWFNERGREWARDHERSQERARERERQWEQQKEQRRQREEEEQRRKQREWEEAQEREREQRYQQQALEREQQLQQLRERNKQLQERQQAQLQKKNEQHEQKEHHRASEPKKTEHVLIKVKSGKELTEEEKAQLRLEKSVAVFIGANLGFFGGGTVNYCSAAVASAVNPFIFIGACTIAGAGLMLLILHLAHNAVDENSETIGYRI